MAALLGVRDADFGSDGAGYGDDDNRFGDFGARSRFGQDPTDFGAAAGRPLTAPGVPPPASPAHLMQVWNAHHLAQANTRRREMLLDPNRGSQTVIERYTMSLEATIAALGTAQALSGSNTPDVTLRPQRVAANTPSVGFITISELRLANVGVIVGGNIDADQWSHNAVGTSMDLPKLTPSTRSRFTGNYSGLVPAPLTGTGAFGFILSFTGPAKVVA